MANKRRRANRAAMFNAMIAAGHSAAVAGAIANTPNWNKTNNRFQYAMTNAPGPAPTPTAAPTPPPPPVIPDPPVQADATQAALGRGVRRPKKSTKRTRLSDLRIGRAKGPKVNTALSIGAGGTGLNVGGY